MLFASSGPSPPSGVPAGRAEDPTQAAAGFDKFFMHDECTGQYPPQPDTCAHERLHEKSFVFGGKAGTVYDVALRIRGIFEPTTIKGGETPYPEHPYFRVGGTVDAPDWSHWHIEVSNPRQTYWLNHYPKVVAHDLQGRLRSHHRGGGGCHRRHPRHRWQRSTDRQREARPGSAAGHRGCGRRSPPGSDVASRRAPRQSALSVNVNGPGYTTRASPPCASSILSSRVVRGYLLSTAE